MFLAKGVITIKGIIMSGGMGTRLRPLTCHLPKPMVPIFNKPVMEYAIDLLKKHGIRDIGVTLYYLPSMIMDYFGEGENFGVNMKYYIEDKPLGTGGSVKNADELLDSTFVVISGDGFTNIDLTKAYEFHKERGSKATLILKREPIPLEYGVVITDEKGKIIRFLEKPSWGEVFSDTINTGIYILEPEVLDYYQIGENFDFSKDLFPKFLKDNIPMYGYISEDYWCDIGDLDTYVRVHEDILKNSKNYYLSDTTNEDIWVGKGTIIEEGCKIIPPVYIGEGCVIKNGATIGPYTVIGNYSVIEEGTSIKRSIIWDNVNISKNCEIRKAVLCNHVLLKERIRIFEGGVIGSYSKIFEDTTIKPKVKIWPYKTVVDRVVVKDNLVWEEKKSRKLFGYRNISGRYNIDITPEIAVGIGSSFSSVIKNKGTYLISSDEHSISKAIKNSISSGIMSTGAQVIDINNSTLPMCRFGVKYYKADGGVHISSSINNEDELHIEFINKDGANIDKNTERKIENTLIIEDFKRCKVCDVKDIVDISNFSSVYLKEGSSRLKNIDKIKNKVPRIIITSPSKNIVSIGEKFLKEIGCNVKVVDYNGKMEIKEFQNIIFDEEGDLGFIYGEDGEKLIVVDSFNVINDEKYFLLTLLIGFKSGDLDKAVIPYNFPRIVEQIVNKYEGNTIYSKTNISNFIQEMLNRNIDFQYTLNFDSILASGIILDYIIGENTSLKEIVAEIPQYFYVKKQIPCSWDDKGSIIRRLAEDRKQKIEMEEGVRFIDEKGWALIIPDQEKPHFNIYIEALNEEYAEELWTFYDDKIREMIGSQ